ncbi:hypothetical protein SprV_0200799000 [Sparganum proliferum]
MFNFSDVTMSEPNQSKDPSMSKEPTAAIAAPRASSFEVGVLPPTPAAVTASAMLTTASLAGGWTSPQSIGQRKLGGPTTVEGCASGTTKSQQQQQQQQQQWTESLRR